MILTLSLVWISRVRIRSMGAVFWEHHFKGFSWARFRWWNGWNGERWQPWRLCTLSDKTTVVCPTRMLFSDSRRMSSVSKPIEAESYWEYFPFYSGRCHLAVNASRDRSGQDVDNFVNFVTSKFRYFHQFQFSIKDHLSKNTDMKLRAEDLVKIQEPYGGKGVSVNVEQGRSSGYWMGQERPRHFMIVDWLTNGTYFDDTRSREPVHRRAQLEVSCLRSSCSGSWAWRIHTRPFGRL